MFGAGHTNAMMDTGCKNFSFDLRFSSLRFEKSKGTPTRYQGSTRVPKKETLLIYHGLSWTYLVISNHIYTVVFVHLPGHIYIYIIIKYNIFVCIISTFSEIWKIVAQFPGEHYLIRGTWHSPKGLQQDHTWFWRSKGPRSKNASCNGPRN